MRKLLSLALSTAMFLYPLYAFALSPAISLTITTDYSAGVTAVHANVGAGYADRRVNVIILNPGFSLSDLTAKTAGAVNWAEQTSVGADGTFSLNMSITPSEASNDPIYTAIAAVDTFSEVLTKTFELYNRNFVNGILAQIKAAIASKNEGKLAEIIEQYSGLLGISGNEEYEDYSGFDAETKTRTVRGIIKENPDTIANFKTAFIAIIAAISLDTLTDTAEYETALTPLIAGAEVSVRTEIANMAAAKKSALIVSLMAEEFDSPTDIVNELNRIFVLGGINSAEIWTEIASVYVKYSDVLGVNTSAYNALKDKQTPMSSLLGQNYKSLENAANAYNSAVTAQKSKESTSSGKGGSNIGGGFSSVIVTGPVPMPVPTPEPSKEPTNLPGEKNDVHFTDLAGYEWAEGDINALAKAGIVKGYDDNNFAPDKIITRAEFTRIFTLAFDISSGDGELKFIDVKPNDWFYDSVKAVFSAGYIQGVSEDSFAPDELVTREDMAVILYRYSGGDYDNPPKFTDKAEISDYARDAVFALSKAGIIKGYEDDAFCPKANALRAEVATLIVRILKGKGDL